MKKIFKCLVTFMICLQFHGANSQNLKGKLLYGGVVNTTNAATLTGSCEGVFSHFPIHANNLWAQGQGDMYLRAAKVSEALSRRVGEIGSSYGPTNQFGDYNSALNNSMAIMGDPNFNSNTAYQAFLFCRNKF